MYIQPRHLSKMLTSYERLKQKKMDQNLVQLKAAGVKNVPKFLLGLNQSANIKVNDMEEVDIGRAVDGDEDVVLFDGEERLCSNSDNDDPSGSKTNEVNGTGPRKKKPCSSAQPLRKSQRTQEQGGSTQGATQAQQLPTSPTEQTDMFCSPHTVVGCEETPASLSRTSQNLKRKRGPTKLKTIAVDGSSPIEVKFDDNGEPIGEGSVKLSSFLGPLVREIVPYTLKDWRKLPLGMAEILWQSIKVRFNLHEEWHRQMVFRRMNEDWRASKSILVKKIRNASNEEERLKLQPDNVKSLHDWKDFVKEKTSKEFKLLLLWFCYGLQCLGICVLVECSKNKTALCFPSMLLHYFGCPVMLLPRLCCCCYGFVGMICYCYGFVGLLLYCCLLCGCFAAVSTVKSENFKAMRDKQLEMQHTMSRKGYARLTAELKVKRDVASISRAVVWANGHRDKNGKPKNKNVAQKIEEMGKIERNGQNSTNLKEDAVSKVLGAERNGRVRTFGKGVTQTRLTILSQMKGQFAELREENAQMKSQMSDMRNSIDEFKKSQVQNPATTEATPTTPLISPSVTCHPQSDITKCKLLDWMGTGDVVAEGRWASSDPHSSAHCVPIGPNAMKVWVDVAKKPEEFLWRAPSDMTYIVDAVGSTIAWPADFVILDSSSPGFMG